MEDEVIIIENNIKSKSPLKVFLIILGVLLGIYLAISFFFSAHYAYGTVIAGQDCSFKSKAKVKERFQSSFVVPIVFTGRHEGDVSIMTNEFECETKYDTSALNFDMDIIEGLCWVENNIFGRNYDVYADISIDEESFKEVLNSSILCAEKLKKEPQNAYLAGYDEDTKEFVIKEGEPGNILDPDVTVKAVQEALTGIKADAQEVRVDLRDKDCYTKSIVSTENAKLVGEKKKADAMLATKVFYDWNGARVTVDADVVKDWLEIKDDKVVLIEDRIVSFVERMADANDTFGKPMNFRTSLRKNITIQRGDYGWKTNTEKEAQALIEHVKNGDQLSKEPEYLYKGYVKGQNDVGNSYVEVDLSNQHVYLYIKGHLELETDCVTGNMSAGHKTPDGIYGITYKALNATLRGPGYESFVYYWMPYCGGVGLHDATWRNKFGGEIYKTSGSHGCVNLPKSAAKQIYESVEKNFPVVTYW